MQLHSQPDMFDMFSVVCFVSLLLTSISGNQQNRKSYSGYTVIEVTPRDRNDVINLHNMMLSDNQVDFWNEPSRVGAGVSVMVDPNHLNDVIRRLNSAGIEHRLRIKDVQKKLSQMWTEVDTNFRAYGDMNLNEFNTLHKINKWMNKTASQCSSGLTCQVYSIGQSLKGNHLNVFKISKTGSSNRKAFWIDATIHAREWISTATAVKIIDHLVKRDDTNAQRLVDQYDWYILPVMNPDGYEHSFIDRYWRKNRRQNGASTCFGVDLNRNFDVKWGTEGVSRDPCSEIYCGTHPASEVEVVAVQNEALRLAPILLGWLTLHSYGHMFMFPYGTTDQQSTNRQCQRVPDHNDLMEVANAAADAIQATHGTYWERGNSCEVIYAAAGGTDDYVKATAGVKYAFVAELRGSNFIIEKSQIQLSFLEIWNGIVAMCDRIAAKEDES
jgi:carboxypeptidase A2